MEICFELPKCIWNKLFFSLILFLNDATYKFILRFGFKYTWAFSGTNLSLAWNSTTH